MLGAEHSHEVSHPERLALRQAGVIPAAALQAEDACGGDGRLHAGVNLQLFPGRSVSEPPRDVLSFDAADACALPITRCTQQEAYRDICQQRHLTLPAMHAAMRVTPHSIDPDFFADASSYKLVIFAASTLGSTRQLRELWLQTKEE